MAIYKNITSADTHALIVKDSRKGLAISKILITNHDDTDSCNIKIQLNDKAGSPTIYVISETNIPARASLLLEDNVKFDNKNYELEAVTSSDADITIIIT